MRAQEHEGLLVDLPRGEVIAGAGDRDRAVDCVVGSQLTQGLFGGERGLRAERRENDDLLVLPFEVGLELGQSRQRQDVCLLAVGEQVGLVGEVTRRGPIDCPAGEQSSDAERQHGREQQDHADRGK